jgi:cytochrome c biogenesis protein CcmG/thiol:disulfide interchange protein DsbE
MTRYVLPVVFLVGLVVMLGIGLRRDPTYVPSPLIGKPAPDFTLPRLEDPSQMLRKTDLLGDVSVVNVWATWCGGCRQEHPLLVQLGRTAGVPFFGIDWKDDNALARQWLAELGNPYKSVAVDADGKTAIDFGVYGAPETFLLDRQGNVIYKHIAPMTVDVWQKEFLPRIAQARKVAG